MKFVKKPVVIEAERLSVFNLEKLEEWCGGSIKGLRLPAKERIIHIQTLEGEMTANIGDWIIKGIAGEFYPCKHKIFEQTYTPVED